MTFFVPESKVTGLCVGKAIPAGGCEDAPPAARLPARCSLPMPGICGIGNKLCWLLAACQSRAVLQQRVPAWKAPRWQRECGAGRPDPRAALASLRHLRVYDLVVCDVMRVLAFRNFTTEEAVWNAGRILETFECALGFLLVSSERRYGWIRMNMFL